MADPVCPNGASSWCTTVLDLTHNDGLARATDWLIAKPLAIAALIIIAVIVRWLIHRMIDRLAARAAAGVLLGAVANGRVHQLLPERAPAAVARRAQRAATMASLLKSVATGIIVVIVIFMAVAQLGYNIAPLIASAGIIGVALGFGAQSLVKDFLSGIFMTLEDQYGVGDVVDIGAATGTIEAVSLRVTRLRDPDGTVWYVRNGEILAVGNKTQGRPGATAEREDDDG